MAKREKKTDWICNYCNTINDVHTWICRGCMKRKQGNEKRL